MVEGLDHLKEKRRKRLSQKKDRRKEEYRRSGKSKKAFRNSDDHDRNHSDWKQSERL